MPHPSPAPQKGLAFFLLKAMFRRQCLDGIEAMPMEDALVVWAQLSASLVMHC